MSSTVEDWCQNVPTGLQKSLKKNVLVCMSICMYCKHVQYPCIIHVIACFTVNIHFSNQAILTGHKGGQIIESSLYIFAVCVQYVHVRVDELEQFFLLL